MLLEWATNSPKGRFQPALGRMAISPTSARPDGESVSALLARRRKEQSGRVRIAFPSARLSSLIAQLQYEADFQPPHGRSSLRCAIPRPRFRPSGLAPALSDVWGAVLGVLQPSHAAQISSQAAQSVPVFQLVTRGDPARRSHVRAVPAIAAQCRGPAVLAQHRPLP
jgi:hypothetical protein